MFLQQITANQTVNQIMICRMQIRVQIKASCKSSANHNLQSDLQLANHDLQGHLQLQIRCNSELTAPSGTSWSSLGPSLFLCRYRFLSFLFFSWIAVVWKIFKPGFVNDGFGRFTSSDFRSQSHRKSNCAGPAFRKAPFF